MQPFGGPGRARRVDVGEEVILADLRGSVVERRADARRRSRARAASRSGRSANVSTCRSRGSSARTSSILCELLRVLDEHADRLGVVDHVRAVPRRAVRVHGCADRADQAEGEVEQAPLEAASRPRIAKASPLRDAEREQAVGDVVHPPRGLRPRDRDPAAVSLGEVRRSRRVRARPRLATALRSSGRFWQLRPSGELTRRGGKRRPGLEFEVAPCARPGTDRSASAW